jgi:peptidylprolyl isomerase
LKANFNALLAALAFAVLLGGAAEDAVVAERGDDQITLGQAKALIAASDRDTQHRLATTPAALKQFLQQYLLQRAILRQAQAEKWDQRTDVAALLQRARDQLLAQSFLAAQAPVPAGYPAEADIAAAYEANKARFMQPRTYHLIQIFAPRAQNAAPDEGRKRLLPVRVQIQHGRVAFEAAAKAGSGLQYLDMGWTPETQIVPAVKAAVIGLPEGAMTDPICTENGCHLIRLVATRPAGPAPLADIRDQLVRALRQQKQEQEETAYASGLLAKQPVAINEIQLAHLAP